MNQMWVFDPDVLSAGVASGLEVLDSASASLDSLRADAADQGALNDLHACLHRVNGIAANVGLADIQGSVCDVEEAIDRLLQDKRTPTREELDLLEEAVVTLRALFLGIDGRTGSSCRHRRGEGLVRLRIYLTSRRAQAMPAAPKRVVASEPPTRSPL